MRKKFRKLIVLLLISMAICSAFVVNTSAYSYVDRTVTFDAYMGYQANGSIGYSTSSGSENWFFGRTTSSIAYFQGIGVKLYCRGWGESLHEVASNFYQSENGAYQGIYVDRDYYTFPLTTYSYHEVKAYDCGVWHTFSGQTAQG